MDWCYNGTAKRLVAHTNARGDVVSLTDKTGGYPIVAAYRYGPWGELLSAEGTCAGQPIRYAGYYHDAETGLYYLKGRYYSPALGRFLTRDPARSSPDYAYAANSPLGFTDSSGLDPDPVVGDEAEWSAAVTLNAMTGERLELTWSDVSDALSKGGMIVLIAGIVLCIVAPPLGAALTYTSLALGGANILVANVRYWGTHEITTTEYALTMGFGLLAGGYAGAVAFAQVELPRFSGHVKAKDATIWDSGGSVVALELASARIAVVSATFTADISGSSWFPDRPRMLDPTPVLSGLPVPEDRGGPALVLGPARQAATVSFLCEEGGYREPRPGSS